MSSTSTLLPRLERLLLDADVPPELGTLLDVVGFRTRRVHDLAATIRKDVDVLRAARKDRRILVCFDRHKDARTRVNWNIEIFKAGGRVIEITEGPGQDARQALGKVLVHLPEWRAHFEKSQDGVAIVQRAGLKFFDRERLRALTPQRALDENLDPSVALRGRQPPRSRARQQKRPPDAPRLPGLP